MNKYILICFLITNLAFSQTYECETNELKVLEYVSLNFDKIQNSYRNIEQISIVINTKQDILTDFSFWKKLNEYDYTLIDNKLVPNKKEKELKPIPEFEKFVSELYAFCPEKYSGSYSCSIIGIPLNLNIISRKIAEFREARTLFQSSYEIPLNGKFKIQLNEFEFGNELVNQNFIESQLRLLNSNIIQLSKNIFLVFSIKKTSSLAKNYVQDYIDWEVISIKDKILTSSKYENEDIFNCRAHVNIREEDTINKNTAEKLTLDLVKYFE